MLYTIHIDDSETGILEEKTLRFPSIETAINTTLDILQTHKEVYRSQGENPDCL
ncbi:MAG TPA: hypothetical protein VI894_01930 [Candidatus Nanoarchaeia archaeon]|nr:hypothetical protein [Candidatus Nanoarchaeia archaeon]